MNNTTTTITATAAKTEALDYINKMINVFHASDPDDIPAEIAGEYRDICLAAAAKYDRILTWTEEADFPDATSGYEFLDALWEAKRSVDDKELHELLGLLCDRVENGDDFEC